MSTMNEVFNGKSDVSDDINASVQRSIIKWIGDNKLSWINEWKKRKLIGEEIFSFLNDESCDFYGSSLLGLFEESSFINLHTSRNLHGCKSNLSTFHVIERANFNKNLKIKVDSLIVDLANNDISYDGVRKMYSIAECFDDYPPLWPALRVLLEWARSNKIVISGGPHYIMRVFELILLFIEVSLSSTLQITSIKTPITIARLSKWIESANDGYKSANLLLNFFEFICNEEYQNIIASRTNPMNNRELIRPEMIKPFHQICEFAFLQIIAENGDLVELLQLSTNCKTFVICKKFMNPNLAKEMKQHEELLLEVMQKSGAKMQDSLNLELKVVGDLYHMIISSSNSRAVLQAERALHNIQENKIASLRMRNRENSSYIQNASVIIPEYSDGPQTKMTFSIFPSENCQTHHIKMLKAKFSVQPNELNVHWKVTEYSRFRSNFIQQIKEYQKLRDEDDGKIKGTNQWRLFGEMKCMLRVGNSYFIQIADSLINSTDSMTLEQVKHAIATLATFTSAEKMKEKRPLLRNEFDSRSSHLKLLAKQQNEQVVKNPRVNNWKVSDLRHAFFAMTSTKVETIKQFAAKHGFPPSDPPPTGVSVSASWKQYNLSIRNFKIYIDNFGVPKNINHRKTRWMSATFKQFHKTELGDVRVYLETCQEPIEDEKRLDTLPEYINKTSILHPDLVKLINQTDFDDADFPSDPLIGSIKNRGWKFTLLRINTCKAMFRNDNGDVLKFNEIRQGNFDADGKFKYLDKHNELEVEMNMESRSNEEICRDSYDMSMKLFEFIKVD